jgi:hypothetical protein
MKATIKLIASLILFVSSAAHASLITINPTSDGSLYTGSTVVIDNNSYLMTDRGLQGVVKFSSAAIDAPVQSAFLTVNAYGLPLWGRNVDIYGYGSSIGTLTTADANAGTFLGTLVLPINPVYGQDIYFDVTSFVSSAIAPFFAFNLRSNDMNIFSSREYNYGHPAQLIVSTVPEPGTMALLLTGLAAAGALRRKTRTPS